MRLAQQTPQLAMKTPNPLPQIAATDGYASLRGAKIEWDACPVFRKAWKMTGRSDRCPKRPSGTIVTRASPGFAHIRFDVAVHMGDGWHFDLHTLEEVKGIVIHYPERQDRAKQIEALCERPQTSRILLEPDWFEGIDDRELQLMFWRFVQHMSLTDIAALYREHSGQGWTRERVRQIINITIRKVQRKAKLAEPTLFRRSPPTSTLQRPHTSVPPHLARVP